MTTVAPASVVCIITLREGDFYSQCSWVERILFSLMEKSISPMSVTIITQLLGSHIGSGSPFH